MFPRRGDLDAARDASALVRRDCHFLWRNRGYRDFGDFLDRLSARRRKNIRRERRRVAEAGIRIEVLTPAFFRLAGERLPGNVRYFAAYRDRRPVAVAFMLEGGDTLYGRHWGCLDDYHSLHFEACYYAGIEYCIRRGLRYFDAGAQGGHKLRRGFEPMETYSAHFVADPVMRAAISNFLTREGEAIGVWHDEQRTHSDFPDAGRIRA